MLHAIAILAIWTTAAMTAPRPLLWTGDEKENPWKKKAPDIVAAAERGSSAAAWAEALDALWRADDWREGLRLATAAEQRFTREASLRGRIARALWRAGQLTRAEATIATLDGDTTDRVALAAMARALHARGEVARARELAARLRRLPEPTAEELSLFMEVALQDAPSAEVAQVAREIARRIDAANGYPDIHMAEAMEGMPEYFDKVGDQPLNRVSSHGSAACAPISMINLPGVDLFVNGKGPFRVIVDTGGSITLSLDTELGETLGLPRLAGGTVRGVSGKDAAWQTIADEVRIGDIVCKCVMTRVFGVRAAAAQSCDGILGTGVFGEARLTFDFANGRLLVEPSSERPAAGRETPLRVIADSKLLSPVTIHGEAATALIDSGADTTALAPSLLRRLFPGEEIATIAAPMAGVGSTEAPGIAFVRGVDVEFAGRKFDRFGGVGLDVLDTILSSHLGVQSDLLIGMAVFREMKSFTVDFPRRRMWIDWLDP
ncbi:MAG: hypothetical protein CHACPFDD_02385 [Phycisphaerae bacterium]|nr:hypothetical protein [Phycisphaerae bacterium]